MREVGRRLAVLLQRGDVVLLTGPLGAGKTTLAQGIGDGLGVRGPVTSPTFVIARVHPALGDGPALVHADGYRLGGRAELDDLDLDADVESSVTVVEWGEGLADQLSEDYLQVTIALPGTSPQPGQGPRPRPAPGDEPRRVSVQAHGDRWAAEAGALSLALGGAAADGHSPGLSHVPPGRH